MKITIVGAGAWGKALGLVCERAGHTTSYWTRNQSSLPAQTDAFILAVPAQALRSVLKHLSVKSGVMISAAKGIERETGKTMGEVVADEIPDAEFLVLSGPSFAADVTNGLPTAVTLAGPSLERATYFAKSLTVPTFRIYPTADIKGVEIGGAMKNVLAIACGISDGQRLGESARASLVTRGFAELMRYAKAQGAEPDTIMGLSGFGDLQLTCSSNKSRNYSYGLAIGKGARPSEAASLSKGVVEGAFTAGIAASLANAMAIEMPIVQAVANIVDGRSSPREEIVKLLARPLRAENE